MSVGGNIIEMLSMSIPHEGGVKQVVRLWCHDKRTGDETCVYGEPGGAMPKLGEEIWWQAGRIYFDGDRRSLRKIGCSFVPSAAA